MHPDSFRSLSTIIFLFVVSCNNPFIFAQTLESFKNGKNEFYDGSGHWGFALSVSRLSNPVAPNPEAHSITGLAKKIDFKKYNFDKGGRRFYFQNKTIGDLLFTLGSEIQKDKGAERGENSALTTGLIGWTSWGWNVLAKPKSALALGFNINDYILGSTYIYTDTQGNKQTPITTEPQGYYWSGGPSLFLDYAISETLVLQAFAGYSFAFWRPVSLSYAQEDKAYPKPQFLHLNAELQTKFHLYGGIDFTSLINRGDLPNDTKRFDIIVGYRF